MKNEMKRARRASLMGAAVLVLLLLAPQAAPRQIFSPWSFEEFASKADLVVVAEHLATVDTGRHTVRVGATRFVEMDSAFVVLAVLKAKTGSSLGAGSRFQLKHYRSDIEEWRREHAPKDGSPPPALLGGLAELHFEAEKGPYLMFLSGGPPEPYRPISIGGSINESVFLLRQVGTPCGRPLLLASPSSP